MAWRKPAAAGKGGDTQGHGGRAPGPAATGSGGDSKRQRGGGAGSGQAQAQQGMARRADSTDEVVYSTFPFNKQDFPAAGHQLSFHQLQKDAEDAGCTVTLRSRATASRGRRARATLVIRGPSCMEIYALFLDAAFALGADLSKVLLPHEVMRGGEGKPFGPRRPVGATTEETAPAADDDVASVDWGDAEGADEEGGSGGPSGSTEESGGGAPPAESGGRAPTQLAFPTAESGGMPSSSTAESGGRAPTLPGAIYYHDEPGFALPTDVVDNVRRSAAIEDALPVKPGVMISLCSTVYARGRQLQVAMGPNLTHLQRHAAYVRWVVVLCRDDYNGMRPRQDLELAHWVRAHYSAFLETGLLVLALAEPHVENGAFHMSRSKNTSHAVGIMQHRGLAAEPQPIIHHWVLPDDHHPSDDNHILVNLDCDNIMGGEGSLKASSIDSSCASARRVALIPPRGAVTRVGRRGEWGRRRPCSSN